MFKRFDLMRKVDHTGVSGTGRVAEGVQFGDGTVVLRWAGDYASTVVWRAIEDAMKVHGHDGATTVRWLDLREERPERDSSDRRVLYEMERRIIDEPDTVRGTLQAIVQLAVGAGSSCWEHLEGAGVFDSTRAKRICDEATDELMDLLLGVLSDHAKPVRR